MRRSTAHRTALLLSGLGALALVAAACHPVDETALPIGDGLVSSGPEQGAVFACTTSFGGGGAFRDGPWIDADAGTWDATEKLSVQGSVDWDGVFSATVDGAGTELEGNGLPTTPTGVFPVQTSDPAYAYDRNPNTIRGYTLDVVLPSQPDVAESASCVGGTIGVSVLGAPIYSAFDAAGRDAVAHEVQDGCDGHPQMSGQYHFHSLSDCWPDAEGLFGYALDGFGIYVERDEDGELLASDDLDECHGRTSEITWHGERVTMYHYVATADFPYLVGCFRGTPITSATGLQLGRPA